MFKTMGYSPGFLLKNGRFSTLAKSPEIDTNGRGESLKSVLKGPGDAFQRVWSEFQYFRKSAMFKTMGKAQAFAQKRPISYHYEIGRNRHKQSRRKLKIIFEGFRSRFREFRAISSTFENPPCSKPWAIARAFPQKRPISDHCEIGRNRHKWSRRELKIIFEGFRNRFREFRAISSTFENPPCSKPWAIAQGFC